MSSKEAKLQDIQETATDGGQSDALAEVYAIHRKNAEDETALHPRATDIFIRGDEQRERKLTM
ncbi:MAG: hypothetical protein Q7S37_03560 [bacterium]|nr:hypothetical protein [bacterium]